MNSKSTCRIIKRHPDFNGLNDNEKSAVEYGLSRLNAKGENLEIILSICSKLSIEPRQRGLISSSTNETSYKSKNTNHRTPTIKTGLKGKFKSH